MKIGRTGIGLFLVVAGVIVIVKIQGHITPVSVVSTTFTPVRQDVPSALTTWPWPRAQEETFAGDIRHWQDTASPGCV